jgi:hypothetical protein
MKQLPRNLKRNKRLTRPRRQRQDGLVHVADPTDQGLRRRQVGVEHGQIGLREDPALFALFRDMGPDLTITTYAFNFNTAQGVNTDQALMNEMNDFMYRRLSLQSFNGGFITTTPMFVTSSDFDPAHYGQDFVSDFASRAGVTVTPGLPLSFLISTSQNPWLSEAGGGHVLDTLRDVLAETASDAAQAVMARHGITPPP